MTRERLEFGAICLALAVATAATYAEARAFPFLDFDDLAYVVRNPQVSGGLSWSGVAWAFTAFHVGNWHPLTWLSHMLDVEMFGLDPAGPHLVNVFLHTANTLILFAVLRAATGTTRRSAVVAGLFALHPLHVESVAWIAERKDVLSTLFGLLALAAWCRFVRTGGRAAWLAAIALFACSLLSKAMLITFPFVLLLLDHWPFERLRGRLAARVREKLPLFALAAAAGVLALVSQGDGVHGEMPLALRVANAATGYVGYLARTAAPVGLAAFYPLAREIAWLPALGSAALLVALSAAALATARRAPYLLVGWFWFLGTLVPVIGLVQVGDQALADRYSYLPLIGIFVAVVWGAADLARHLRVPAAATAALATVALIGCALGARAQVALWRDERTLFTHALRVTHGNFFAHTSLGTVLRGEGDADAAERHYREALRLHPGYPRAEAGLGAVLLERGEAEAALRHFERARAGMRGDSALPYHIGLAHEQLGHYERAAQAYQEQIALAPEHRQALARLAYIRAAHPDPRIRDARAALALARRACELGGYRQPRELDVLAAAQAENGRFADAAQTATLALALARAQGEAVLLRDLEARRSRYLAGRPARLAERDQHPIPRVR